MANGTNGATFSSFVALVSVQSSDTTRVDRFCSDGVDAKALGEPNTRKALRHRGSPVHSAEYFGDA